MSKIKRRWKMFLYFAIDRFSEPSTWQGIGFMVAASGSKFGADLDWGQAAFIGATVSAFMKMVSPDQKK